MLVCLFVYLLWGAWLPPYNYADGMCCYWYKEQSLKFGMNIFSTIDSYQHCKVWIPSIAAIATLIVN